MNDNKKRSTKLCDSVIIFHSLNDWLSLNCLYSLCEANTSTY